MREPDAEICYSALPSPPPEQQPSPAATSHDLPHGFWRGALSRFVVTGGMAAAALALASALELRPWVLFLTWVGYGLLGGTAAAGRRLLFGFAVGVAAGMAIVPVGLLWAPSLGVAAMPLALGLGCGLLAALELRPPLDVVPAYFLGMIAFFASGGTSSPGPVVELTAPAVLGVIWGWAATLLRQRLEFEGRAG